MVCIKPIVPQVNVLIRGFEMTVNYWKEELVKDCKMYEVYEREQYYLNPTKNNNGGSGLQRLKVFEWTVENGYKDQMSRFQREFMQSMIKAELEHIIGEDDWARYGTTIIKERGWQSRRKVTIGQAPRRFGKTTVLSRNCATVLKLIPITQALYSTGEFYQKEIGLYV